MKLRYSFDKAFERPTFFLTQAIKLALAELIPKDWTEKKLLAFERQLTTAEKHRVDYYLKSNNTSNSHFHANKSVGTFRKHKNSFQYYDIAPLIKRFDKDHSFNILFGDITQVPDQPTFVKSRPIGLDNENSVLLKLGTLRHFYFLKDTITWEGKSDSAMWRGHAHNSNRRNLVSLSVKNQHLDAAQTNQDYPGLPPKKPFLSIPNQLRSKFIISIEGNDVATNLKWALNSNSLVISPKLKYETWFLEGTLVQGEHFAAVEDDFSDIEEVIEHYLTHTEEAKQIIKSAQEHTQQFKNKEREKWLNLLVIRRYFELNKA